MSKTRNLRRKSVKRTRKNGAEIILSRKINQLASVRLGFHAASAQIKRVKEIVDEVTSISSLSQLTTSKRKI